MSEKPLRITPMRPGAYEELWQAHKAYYGDESWARVDKSGGCWLWTGRLDEHGYGRIGFFRRRNLGAHRVAYALARNGGELPSTRVRHACSNRACVNPDHLSAGALS